MELEGADGGLLKMIQKKRFAAANKLITPKIYARERSSSIDLGKHSLLDGICDAGAHEDIIFSNSNNKSKFPKFFTRKESKTRKDSSSDMESHSTLSCSPPEIAVTSEESHVLGEPLDYIGEQLERRCHSVDYNAILNSDNASLKAVLSLLAYDGLQPEEDDNLKPKRNSIQIQPLATLVYEVKNTDTLAKIAAQHKSTVANIKKINKLMTDMVFPGQMLYVPGPDYVDNMERPLIPADSSETLCPDTLCPATLCPETFCPPTNEFAEIKLLKDRPRRFSSFDPQTILSIKPRKKSKKRDSVFTADVKYIADDESSVAGVLTITSNEVKFEPSVDDEDLQADLVRYRMSLGRNIVAAWLTDGLHFAKAKNRSRRNSYIESVYVFGKLDEDNVAILGQEDISMTAGEEMKLEGKYLRVKLGIPEKAMKEMPTISKLLRESIPNRPMMEHYFQIQDDLAKKLDEFMVRNYNSIYNKSESGRKKSKGLSLRNLSADELYNLPLPPMSAASSIVDERQCRLIIEHLPPKADGRPWFLVYSTHVHGFSLQTLYRRTNKIRDTPATLLIIKDSHEQIFGALLSSNLIRKDGVIGTGESFLFSFYPTFKTFKWTGKNDYFARADNAFLSFGVSDGNFGLCIDEEIHKGRSCPCETYNNDVLSVNSDFHIIRLEVWSFPFSINSE